MHYYQFNIGDYASHTRHLDLLEDLAYRRILDLYYLHERPLNDDATVVAKQIGMRDDAATVRDVLNEFFERTDDGYISSRADKEIANFRSKIEQASRAGKASAERRFNGRSTGVPTDVQPNNKQETINIKQETKKKTVAPPDGVTESVWADFLILRKGKKMAITETALNGLMREASKARISLDAALRICCERGWGGFKAEWLDQPHQAQKTAHGPNLAAARAIFGDERQLPADFILEEGHYDDRTPKIA
jgi:uncharacterized protein YdaU (DUF1376 family)